jgi:hypothetical protein
MNIRTASASLGLQGLVWNSFSAATTNSAYAKIAPPSQVVTNLTTVLGASKAGASQLILGVSSGVLPAWIIPGAAVAINVTYGGISYIFGQVVREVTATTLTLAMNPMSDTTFSTALANVSLDAVGGAVVNTVTLIIQAQKAMFSVLSGAGGNVNLAPVADSNGANPGYFVTITAGGSEYEVTAQPGSKFDIGAWWAQSSAGTVNLTCRFL